jgi:hypothetical protein
VVREAWESTQAFLRSLRLKSLTNRTSGATNECQPFQILLRGGGANDTGRPRSWALKKKDMRESLLTRLHPTLPTVKAGMNLPQWSMHFGYQRRRDEHAYCNQIIAVEAKQRLESP